MKAEELMIGDWVIEKDRVCRESFNTIIEEVREEDCATSASNSTRYYDIEPILLTPEILEKNGFDLDKDIVDCELYESIDNRVTIHNYKVAISSKNKWHVDVDNENYSTIASCELTYVHELQHILRLCKIEKEIVM